MILTFIWKHERPQITKAILTKDVTTPDFRIYYRAIVTKTT
jgi:hypothetical protein